MSKSSSDQANLTAQWDELGIPPGEFIKGASETLGRGFAATLAAPANIEPQQRLSDDEMKLGPILGEGGMGVVRLAEQPSLRRFVAVKQPHPGRARRDVVQNLLREAWVGGSLEHPNIVPIHALAERDGEPLIVMKHIEGRSWATVLEEADPAHDLEWHLQVFMHVCHAVHFAHARGVLHLDLKPDNVMLGEFGEVYLLDWGLAVSIDENRPDWMPAAWHVRGILGTPRYMSPEQAGGDGAQFGRTTDVYLLGAILVEVVTGQPIHGRGNAAQSILQAWRGLPLEMPEAPSELAGLIRKATARHPGDRFPTAESLRLAVERFIGHRESLRLVEEAQARIEALRGGTGDWLRAVTEARFGLRQALKIWPQNPDAAAALQTMGALEVQQAINVCDLPRARAGLAELPHPDPDLEAAVNALAQAAQAEAREVEALRVLQKQTDRNSHHKLRSLWSGAVGVVWLIWNLVCGWLFRNELVPLTHEVMLALSGFAMVSVAAGVWVVRRTILTTEINRRGLGLLAVHIFGSTIMWFLGWQSGLPTRAVLPLVLALYSSFAWSMAIAVDARLIKIAALASVLSLFAAALPNYPFEVIGVVGSTIAIGTGIVWRRPVPEDE